MIQLANNGVLYGLFRTRINDRLLYNAEIRSFSKSNFYPWSWLNVMVYLS